MAKPSPSLYSISKTFVWFAIVSIILTVSLGVVVWTDYSRDWKMYQKQFVQLKLKKAQADLKAANDAVDKAELDKLNKEYAAADAALKAHQAQYSTLLKDIDSLDNQAKKVRSEYQSLKQFSDSYRYFFEEYSNEKDPRAAEYDKKMKDLQPKLEAKKVEQEGFEKQRDDKQAEADKFVEKEKSLKHDLDKVLSQKALVERRLQALKPNLAKKILNAPMLDFIAPSLKIQQIVLPDLTDDYHFAKVQKVDRCTTCHLAIDQKGFEDAPEPFRTHPNLDLYLGSGSPHPIEKIGCTVCHGGSGHSAGFITSAHTPHSEEQMREWQKKYHWHEMENVEQKMLPLQFTQAACAKCHTGTIEVPKADQLNRGRRLAEVYGCLNCHKIDGYENRWKVGPDLENVKSKLDPEWIAKWLEDPTAFRHDTKMPKIFNLTNTSSPEDRDRNDAAIRSIAAYLMKNSGTVELTKPPVAGDAARGENLVKTIGCTGCHTVAGVSINDYAPSLSGLGSKVNAEWLYTWLKNPKHYSPGTRMPNLRLSDQEAADIAAYLLMQKNEKFEETAAPQAKPAVVDQMILDNLQGTMRESEAKAELAKMSPEERLQFLGKKSIAFQGCFTCHTIKGFDDMKPIGADLSNEGAKDLHQFDFGFVPVEHSRQGFIEQKLKDPRSYDEGKVKAYYEKLRMPQFHFSDEERQALTTFVLSLTQEEMPLKMVPHLDSKDLEVEKGRLLIHKLNCNGCHTVDGKVGNLREKADDPGMAPPVLIDEGEKVQEKWLHDFLTSPTPIRPWLHYRMPTFGFSEDELDTLVHTFAYLSHQEIAYRGLVVPPTTPEKLAAGKSLFNQLQCAKCHEVNAESSAMGASFLAPNLAMAKTRLKPEWVKQWITDPQQKEPGTMMPTFFADGQTPIQDVLGGNAQEQITAIRDYLYTYEKAPAAPASTSQNSSKDKSNA